MSQPWVLKFPRQDGHSGLLVQVSSYGDDPLDLDLLATEGEAPYKGKIRHRKVSELRSKAFRGDDEEWRNMLLHTFNPHSAPTRSPEHHTILETIATAGSGTATVTFRRRVDRLTQKLGSIELSQDDEAEIQLADWCGLAIDQKAIVEAERDELRSSCATAQVTIASLETKLEELVKAKSEHEDELMSKFVLLLNEKKLKIRNQQRVLGEAKVEPGKLKEIEQALEGRDRKAESSRAGKRRATAAAQLSDDEDDSDDAFEKMDVDAQAGERSSGEDTNPEANIQTETEEESGEDPTRPISHPDPPKTSNRTTSRKQPQKTSTARSVSPPPPVRQLPFKRRGAQNAKAAEPESPQDRAPELQARGRAQPETAIKADDSGEATASDGDEL